MKDLEPDDPLELVGTGYPVADPEETDRQAARCLIEEYALMGVGSSQILGLFTSPMYGHTHAIYRRRGAGFVSKLIDEVFGVRR